MLDVAERRVLVLGLGISGRSAAAFCAARGARVVAADERPASALGPLGDLGGASLAVGRPFPDPADFDLVVPSPGVPRARYAASARRVWGDIELAGRALQVPIVAVTGTNGKSTTTTLIEAMLCRAGLRARAAGNLGVPALDLVGAPLDVAVLEVSSFQLETVEAFRPRVAVILNVAPDHLDRHGSFEAYAAAKARVFAAQTADDWLVANLADPVARALAEQAPSRLLGFHRDGVIGNGACFDQGAFLLRLDGASLRLPADGMRLVGSHNVENALAALAACAALGADLRRATEALLAFEGLPHRCQVVARRAGVTWVDDSKATNVAAAARALEGFPEPVVWIAGGRDKGLDFAPLAAAARGRVHAALLIGESAPALARALRDSVPVLEVGKLDAAVREAARRARPGDVVLLAPACASFDQFRNFEERGQRFRDAVQAIDREEEA
jgi:UDP-N-acetylmuramoylalanine--D-glutamate ligase